MAWVAVDKDGSEYVYTREVTRRIKDTIWSLKDSRGLYVLLPKGSSEKRIGRKLTWDDEPVELK